jgi:septal ring factor EnvC (AmiA/AmiB activator)
MKLKVEGGQFVKDTTTNALLAVNKNLLKENQARKLLASKLNNKNDEINTLKEKVENLNNDISEMKEMLKLILKKE